MTQLLEIKDKLVKFYGNYELYVKMAIKFVVALTAFLIINLNIGFMSKISNFPVALILALLCSILPTVGTVLIASLVIVADMYALSMEAALVTLVLLAILYLMYFRFAPKDGYMAVLTPIAFKLNIPYLVPVAGGLTRNLSSAVSMICGTILFYFLDGVHKSASTVAGATGDVDANSKLNVIVGQITGNKEMFLVIGIFTVAYLLVSLVRKLEIDNAWTIAIATGVIFQLVGLVAGYLIIGVSGKMLGLILGSIISGILAYVVKFLFMELDYARTERVQFEDDDYYYYVKAVPKKMVASKEKTVKRFGNTTAMGKKIDHAAKSDEGDSEIGRRIIAKELDIDEDLLK